MFNADRLLYQSTLGLRVMKREREGKDHGWVFAVCRKKDDDLGDVHRCLEVRVALRETRGNPGTVTRYGHDVERYGHAIGRYGHDVERYSHEVKRYGHEIERYGHEVDFCWTKCTAALRSACRSVNRVEILLGRGGRALGLGIGLQGLGSRFWGYDYRVQGLGSRNEG